MPRRPSLVRRPKRHTAVVKRRLGSRIGNGTALLPGTDHRGPQIRRLKSLLADFKSDVPEPSTAERLIIGHAAYLELIIEKQKADLITRNMKVRSIPQLLAFLRTIQAQRRLLVTVGLKRRAKEIDSLESYLERTSGQQNDVIDAELVDEAEPAEPTEAAA